MTYVFELTVGKEKSKLSLFHESKEVASKEWPESRDMGKKLFEAIDEVLREQGLKAEDITDFQVMSDLPEFSTSRRIAETVQKVYTFGVSLK